MNEEWKKEKPQNSLSIQLRAQLIFSFALHVIRFSVLQWNSFPSQTQLNKWKFMQIYFSFSHFLVKNEV